MVLISSLNPAGVTFEREGIIPYWVLLFGSACGFKDLGRGFWRIRVPMHPSLHMHVHVYMPQWVSVLKIAHFCERIADSGMLNVVP